MKKLIALFAVTTLASTSAIASVALSGSASVTYDDRGSSSSSTSYDADVTFTGTAGGTTLTASYDMEGASLATTAVDLSTEIGPVTIAADMFQVNETNKNDGDGDYKEDQDDTGVTMSLDVPIGDATIGVDNSGDVTVSGTFSGVTVTHTAKNAADKTVVAAAVAGMDIDITNDGGSTTWSVATTVAGADLTLNSGNDITAAFGLAGNTLTVSHYGSDASVSAGTTTGTAKFAKEARAAYTTVAISRDLTSGATLTATYDTQYDGLAHKAAVSFYIRLDMNGCLKF